MAALRGISLDVPGGTSLALTGPSGCGKSTLLSLVAGLDRPDSGRVVVGDHELSGLPDGRRAELRRRELGLLFQVDNLLPFLTVRENVALSLALAGRPADDTRCRDLLDRLGIGDQVDKLPDHLSGGQRQRVAVARALVHRPRVILADEPTGALDEVSSTAVIDLLLAAQQETGATLVVVSHDPLVAARLGRTVALRDGAVARGAAAGAG